MEETKKLKRGINPSISNEDYHADKSYLSSSQIKLLLKDTEQFYKEVILGERERIYKAAFDEGSYAHTLILEPEMVETEYRFFKGFRKAGKEWEEFKKANHGYTMLSFPQRRRVEKWVEAYEALPAAKSLISGGFAEHTVTGKVEGLDLKARADYINVDKGYIVDVKTTSYDPGLDGFKQTIKDFRYDLSAAMYTKLFNQAYNKNFDFYFIVLGKKNNECEVFKMSRSTMEDGLNLFKKALNIYKACKASNNWINLKERVVEKNTDDYEILEV